MLAQTGGFPFSVSASLLAEPILDRDPGPRVGALQLAPFF